MSIRNINQNINVTFNLKTNEYFIASAKTRRFLITLIRNKSSNQMNFIYTKQVTKKEKQ